jgi:thioredoxin 1
MNQNLQSNKIVDLKSESDFDSEVLNNKEPVIVDFYADWCGPCKKLGPMLEKACVEEKIFKIVKINVDNHRELSDRYKVKGIPYVILFHNGKKQMEFTGLNVEELKKMIELCKNLSKY